MVSRLIMGIVRVLWVIEGIYLFTKSPDPPSRF